jgi:hypothetical protein
MDVVARNAVHPIFTALFLMGVVTSSRQQAIIRITVSINNQLFNGCLSIALLPQYVETTVIGSFMGQNCALRAIHAGSSLDQLPCTSYVVLEAIKLEWLY